MSFDLELRLTITVLTTIIVLIITPFCFGFGYSSLNSGKNTETVGTILSFKNAAFEINRCFANVSFVDSNKRDVVALIDVPCQSQIDLTFLPIRLCYNRKNPLNAAFDDPRLAKDSEHYADRRSPCSSTGFTEAYNDVVVGWIFIVLLVSILGIVWGPLIFHNWSYRPIPSEPPV